MAQEPERHPQGLLDYVDHPEIYETFADHLEKLTADNTTIRLEFCVFRMGDPKKGESVRRGERHTACRVVLPLTGFDTIYQKVQLIASALEQRGMFNRAAAAPLSTADKPPGKPN